MAEPNDKGILLTAAGDARGAAPSLAPAPSEMRPAAGRRFTLIGFGFILAIAVATAAFTLVFTSRSRIVANQNNAGAALKQLMSHEATWKQGDFDQNGQLDYWTRDVAGFHCVHDKGGKPVNLIDRATAVADFAPGMPYPELAGLRKPRQGYFFQAMMTDQDGGSYRQWDLSAPKAMNAPTEACTNTWCFGFTAFPKVYGSDGALSFVIGQDGVVWQKDLGAGLPILDRRAAVPPEDPRFDLPGYGE